MATWKNHERKAVYDALEKVLDPMIDNEGHEIKAKGYVVVAMRESDEGILSTVVGGMAESDLQMVDARHNMSEEGVDITKAVTLFENSTAISFIIPKIVMALAADDSVVDDVVEQYCSFSTLMSFAEEIGFRGAESGEA